MTVSFRVKVVEPSTLREVMHRVKLPKKDWDIWEWGSSMSRTSP